MTAYNSQHQRTIDAQCEEDLAPRKPTVDPEFRQSREYDHDTMPRSDALAHSLSETARLYRLGMLEDFA